MENLAQDCGSQWYREGTGLVSSYCFNLARRTTKNGRRSTFVLLPEGRPDHSSKRLALASFGNDRDRKSTRLNSSHRTISYAVFCLKKKKKNKRQHRATRMSKKI